MSEEIKKENNEDPIKNEKETKADKYLDPETKKFKEGNPGGPGRPKGTRDWKTDFEEAIKIVAKETGKTISEVRTAILIRGISEARRGNYNFWKEILDRDYGKVSQGLDFGADETIESIKIEIVNDTKDKSNKGISEELGGISEEEKQDNNKRGGNREQ